MNPTTRSSHDVRAWFVENQESLAVLAGVLRILHPEQYHIGFRALHGLLEKPEWLSNPSHISDLLRAWALPFTGAAVLVNRETLPHRDKDAPLCGFDLCATLGDYNDGYIVIPDLHTHLAYQPGTVIFLLARTLVHEVAHVNGGRAAIVLFNKDPVQEGLRL